MAPGRRLDSTWIAPKHLVASAFASGALSTALAFDLFEESFREGGPLFAFATTAGFLLSFLLAEA